MKQILVIDDEAELAGCIKSILETDHEVFTVSTGKDGLDLLSREKLSLVVLDYSLPDMNGLEILSRIRESHDIPVIMITAHGNKELVLKSWRYRADYYFDKPLSLKELRKKVRELLSESFPFVMVGLDPDRLSPTVFRALNFIGSTLSSQEGRFPGMRLKEVAAVLKVSPQHLSALFRKECGKGFNEIMHILKVERARKLLEKGRDIKEIALELGYSNPNNFSRFFKRLTGTSFSKIRTSL